VDRVEDADMVAFSFQFSLSAEAVVFVCYVEVSLLGRGGSRMAFLFVTFAERV
jgi:hypothetical protein